jgi:ABC-2 type transport system ATP-binding protein
MNPAKHEVPVKSRLAWVPDTVTFYPWMSIGGYFEYLASFREKWNAELENSLLDQFELDPARKVTALSKGEKMQVALIGALCPEPDLLVLDEPTSGLDPLVRREFIRTVIGAYQEGDPENRTVFVSTHLITEFEGLIDEFTVIDKGRDILAMKTEDARGEFRKLIVRFPGDTPDLKNVPCLYHRDEADGTEVFVRGDSEPTRAALTQAGATAIDDESLSLEEIFLTTLHAQRNGGGIENPKDNK